jgi:hypothetical protein
VIGAVQWWVDYAGVTQVGTRPAATLDPKAYQVLTYDPRAQDALVTVDDPSAVTIGSVLAEGLDAPITVREFELVVTATEMRVHAWCGGVAGAHGNLADSVRAIVQRLTDQPLHGLYRYRVERMSGDRVELQVVKKSAGLPDVFPLSIWPGVAGVHAVLSPGAEVLVQFVEGSRAQPVVTHFAGKDGVGFTPVSLVLGGPSGGAAARMGDTVEVLLPPAVFSGTIGGSPATGVITFILNKAMGTITSGSPKVSIAP